MINNSKQNKIDKDKSDKKNEFLRPPIVVVLGHIDHGKTSLLDYIRKTNVTQKESGGITQHIGAYEAEYQNKKITFIDTPGHESFSVMRSRGTKIADIAVLVIAADEGIKSQTKEALSIIKRENIPFIIAINKIDKPQSNSEKVKRELAKENILVESMGGDITCVETSAKTGKGINDLLDLIEIIAEIKELKGNLEKPGEGVILESYLDSQKGPTATLIVRNGVLKQGDIIATPDTLGKVKLLKDFQGVDILKAIPSQPCFMLGFEKIPRIEKRFQVFPNIETAKKFIQENRTVNSNPQQANHETNNLTGHKSLNLILKLDFLGSKEAIEDILHKLPKDKVILNVVYIGVGDVSESDIKLAEASQSKIIGFRVKSSPAITQLAKHRGITVLTFDILYNLYKSIYHLMEMALKPKVVEKEIGQLKTLVVFRTEKNRQIIGGKVIQGYVTKGLLINILRGDKKIGQGKIINLQKNKKNIDRGQKGEEIGILYEGNTRIEEDDILIFYLKKVEKEVLS